MKKYLAVMLVLLMLFLVGCGKKEAVVSEAYDYDGELKGQLAHGEGKLFEEGKMVYEGGFKDGIIHGEGKLYENEILVYEGGFSEAKPIGKGAFYRQGIIFFNGNILRNEGNTMELEGLLHTPEGIPYFQGGLTLNDGEIELKSPGILLYPEGEKMYEGPIVNNAPTKEGTYYSLDGLIIETQDQ